MSSPTLAAPRSMQGFAALKLHPVLAKALVSLPSASRDPISASSLLARVLSRTNTDFADVVVDSRCATGSSTAGSTSAIWLRWNNHGGGAAESVPLYMIQEAVLERQQLISLYALQCVVTCAQESSHKSEVAVILASGPLTSIQLHEIVKPIASNCGVDVSVVAAGTTPAAREGRPSVLITTLEGFLTWDTTYFGASGGSAERGIAPHVAAVVAEDVGVVYPGSALEQRWDKSVEALLNSADRAHLNYAPSIHQLPHFMLLCRGPLSSVSPLLRARLSRRNRRYYPLVPAAPLLSSTAALVTAGPGTTSPMEDTRMVYLFSLDEKDKLQQLRSILLHTQKMRRVLLMTHNRDIRHLYSTIEGWGMFSDERHSSTDGGSPSRLFFVQRTDTPDRQLSTYIKFLSPPKKSGNRASLLLTWDAFTGMDMMDVDVVIQLHPPQKSLPPSEWAEYIQVLHSTGDGETAIEASLRRNPKNTEQNISMKLDQLRVQLTTPSLSEPNDGAKQMAVRRPSPTIITMMENADFALTSYFVLQYNYSGGSGTLTPTALGSSLAAVGPAPGKPGSVVPSSNPALAPVLNIAPDHPQFASLVCNVEADGVPTREAAYVLGEVLKSKLSQEKSSQQQQVVAAQGVSNFIAKAPGYLLPGFYAGVSSSAGGDGSGGGGTATAAAKMPASATPAGGTKNNKANSGPTTGPGAPKVSPAGAPSAATADAATKAPAATTGNARPAATNTAPTKGAKKETAAKKTPGNHTANNNSPTTQLGDMSGKGGKTVADQGKKKSTPTPGNAAGTGGGSDAGGKSQKTAATAAGSAAKKSAGVTTPTASPSATATVPKAAAEAARKGK